MKHMGHLTFALLLAFLFVGQAQAQTSTNAMVVDHPWARATPRGAKTGAVYLTLLNHGGAPDRLLSATTPLADKVQFHSVSEDNGVSHMREMKSVEVNPGGKITFSPGGMHIMLVGLKQPPKEGQSFSMTFIFEKAGKEDVAVPIAGIGAMQHSDMSDMMHEHGDMKK